jgi:hypothetical protein
MRLTRAPACVLAAEQQAALAGGGPGSGGFFGSVSCGKAYSAQCTVPAGSGPSAGTAAGGGGAADGCAGTENKTFGWSRPAAVRTGRAFRRQPGVTNSAFTGAVPLGHSGNGARPGLGGDGPPGRPGRAGRPGGS